MPYIVFLEFCNHPLSEDMPAFMISSTSSRLSAIVVLHESKPERKNKHFMHESEIVLRFLASAYLLTCY